MELIRINKTDKKNQERIVKIEDLLSRDVKELEINKVVEYVEELEDEIKTGVSQGKIENMNERLQLLLYQLSQKKQEANKIIDRVSFTYNWNEILEKSGQTIPIVFTVDTPEGKTSISSLKTTVREHLNFSQVVARGIVEKRKTSVFSRIFLPESYEPLEDSIEDYFTMQGFASIISEYNAFHDLFFEYASNIGAGIGFEPGDIKKDLDFVMRIFNTGNIVDSQNKLTRMFEKFIRHYRSLKQFGNVNVLNINKRETLSNHIDYLIRNNLVSVSEKRRMKGIILKTRNFTSHESVTDIQEEIFILSLLSFFELLMIIEEK